MKSVKFSDEQTVVNGTFKTFPKKALRLSTVDEMSTISLDSDTSSRLDQTIMDIYNRFVIISEIDQEACIKHLTSGNCSNLLVRYSVLNILLKNLPPSDEISYGSRNSVLTPNDCVKMIKIAINDFKKLASSSNVLELSTLQQIMRCVESIWVHFGWDSEELKIVIQSFTQGCIALIGDRPSSKILLSPAIRLSNTALNEKMLNDEQVSSLVTSLSNSQLLNTSSFTADAISALFSIYKLYSPSILSNRDDWVGLALRGLASSFHGIRSHAYTILSTFNVNVIPALGSDKHNKDPEPILARSLPFKLASLTQGIIFEDVLVVAKSIIMVIKQSSLLVESWPYIEGWTDALQIILRKHPKLIPTLWSSIIDCKMRDNNYYIIIIAPFIILSNSPISTAANGNFDTSVYTMLLDVFQTVDVNNLDVWERLLAPLLKLLATRREYQTAAAWAHAVSYNGMIANEHNILAYVDVLDVISRNTSREEIGHISDIWGSIVNACSMRSNAMELVKYHYKVLSPDTKNSVQQSPSPESSPCKITNVDSSPLRSPNRSPSKTAALLSSSTVSKDIIVRNKIILSLALANGLINKLDHEMLLKRPNKKQYNLLTLILLPIVSFLDSDQRLDCIEKLIANNPEIENYQRESTDDINPFMRALLWTVEAGSDNQPQKWVACCTIVEELLNFSDNTEAQKLIFETLVAFIPIMKKAEKPHWQLWEKVFFKLADKECRLKVLSKIPSKLPILGLLSIIGIPESICKESNQISSHRTRVIIGSLNEFNIEIAKKELKSNEYVDLLARTLVQQKKIESVKLASKLMPSNRLFIVAKALLQIINDSDDVEFIEYWNSTVSGILPKNCLPFLSSYSADKLKKLRPNLKIPDFLIMPKDSPNTSQSLKRPLSATIITPPSAGMKRARRTILTGSVPSSLNTPPASDSLEDVPPVLSEELSSSPPPLNRNYRVTGAAPSKNDPVSVPRDPQDKARLLKRLLLRLNMAEAVQSMKPSEQLMIYNMLFKSCVALKTHISSSTPLKTESELESARTQLDEVVSHRNVLDKREQKMIANGIAKKNAAVVAATEIENYDSDSGADSDSDSEKSDVNDDDSDEFIPRSLKVKLEV